MAVTEDPEIKAAMQDVLATKDVSHAEVVQKNGMSCCKLFFTLYSAKFIFRPCLHWAYYLCHIFSVGQFS